MIVLKASVRPAAASATCPILFVNIELTALCPSAVRKLGLVDRRGDAVEVKNTCEDEPAKARADDRDGCQSDPLAVCFLSTRRMSSSIEPTARRTDALSRERIVEAAISILDTAGAGALTFRALAARLATGSGAIYWHVADKQALLEAATDQVIARALAGAADGASPGEAIRVLALGVFDAIDTRPWVGAQLSGNPWQHAVLRILESVGAQVTELGIPEQARFNAATALLSFILGLAGQYAVGSRHFVADMDRTAFLRTIAAQWAQLDPVRHPFVRQAAAQLPEHDDREQFWPVSISSLPALQVPGSCRADCQSRHLQRPPPSLVGWSKTLAAEVGRDGVTSNIVLPGRVATSRITFLDERKADREGRSVTAVAADSAASIPLGRYGDPQEYGDVVAFLASERAPYITGSVIRIDGGFLPSI